MDQVKLLTSSIAKAHIIRDRALSALLRFATHHRHRTQGALMRRKLGESRPVHLTTPSP